jgi:hypothetical protein
MRDCPEEAIFDEADVPEDWVAFISLNSKMAAQCPTITPELPTVP